MHEHSKNNLGDALLTQLLAKLFAFNNSIIKISHSEDTRLAILWVGGTDTTKIMPPKLSLAYMYLLHIDWKLFRFYYKFKFCFPDILGVVVVLILQL